MDPDARFQASQAWSSSNPPWKAPNAFDLPSSDSIPTWKYQLPNYQPHSFSSNTGIVGPVSYSNPPSAPRAFSTSSSTTREISLDISPALIQLFSRAQDFHRQSTLYGSLPSTDLWQSTGLTPTPAQLAYRDDIEKKFTESKKAMETEVEGVVEKVRAALALEVKDTARSVGLQIAALASEQFREEARARNTENADVVFQRLSYLEKALQDERQARQEGEQAARDQCNYYQAERMELSTRIAYLEGAQVVREWEMENLRKEKVERDIELKNKGIEMKKKDISLQSLLERLENLEAPPIQGFVRQEDFELMIKTMKELQNSLKRIGGLSGEMKVRQVEFEKQMNGTLKAIEGSREEFPKGPDTRLRFGAEDFERKGDLMGAMSALKKYVKTELHHVVECLAGREDSFLKTELSVIQAKVEHIDSLDIPSPTSPTHPTTLHQDQKIFQETITEVLLELAPMAQSNKAFRTNLLGCLGADDVEDVATRQDQRKILGERLVGSGAGRSKTECIPDAVQKIEVELDGVKSNNVSVSSNIGKAIQEVRTSSGDSTSNRGPPSPLIIAKPVTQKYLFRAHLPDKPSSRSRSDQCCLFYRAGCGFQAVPTVDVTLNRPIAKSMNPNRISFHFSKNVTPDSNISKLSASSKQNENRVHLDLKKVTASIFPPEKRKSSEMMRTSEVKRTKTTAGGLVPY